MTRSRITSILVFVAAGIAGAAYIASTVSHSRSMVRSKPATAATARPRADDSANKIVIGEQAQRNLQITAKSLGAQSYWKTISVIGTIVDRPGVSNREVVSPAIGVISKILCVPGESVATGGLLFNLTITSESLHETQADLFKATESLKMERTRLERLQALDDTIAGSKIIETKNEITQLEVSAKALRHELLTHGFSQQDVDFATAGDLRRELTIHAPPDTGDSLPPGLWHSASNGADRSTFELQQLAVEVGQQVQAGQLLCRLSNHQSLAVEGRAFHDEMPRLERSIQEGWPVEIDFQEIDSPDWPPLEQRFSISHLASIVDPVTRTFEFLIPISNQAKEISNPAGTRLLWRFRPGQKVRVLIRVEQLDDVFVLPVDAVVREEADTFLFAQNVNTFSRLPVHMVHRDQEHVVIANNGALPTFVKDGQRWTIAAIVQNAARQLNRIMKADSSETPSGFHVHADGSLHSNHDEP